MMAVMERRHFTAEAPLVSACIIARDEEQHIGACIRSLRGLADEVVVVDTGSTDSTPELARSLGARVFVHPWQDDFSLHRNQSLDYARGGWVLVIDADEVVEPADFAETRARLAGDDLPRLLMVRHWSTYPGELRVLEYMPRLFRRDDDLRYVHPLHEQLTVSGEEAVLSNLVLRHGGYTDRARLRAKQQRNHLLALAMPEHEPHTHHCRMRALVGLGDWDGAAEAARTLLGLAEAPEDLIFEAHIVAATASFRLDEPQRATFVEHTESARALFPHAADVAYLDVMRASATYLRALDGANHPGSQEYLRIGQLWHMGEGVRALLRGLTLPEAAHPRRGRVFPASPARNRSQDGERNQEAPAGEPDHRGLT